MCSQFMKNNYVVNMDKEKTSSVLKGCDVCTYHSAAIKVNQEKLTYVRDIRENLSKLLVISKE